MTLAQRIRQWLPEWGPVRWTAVALALLVLVTTGVSLFSRPDYEVLYSPTRIAMPSEEAKGTLVFYTIEVGNTGTEPQDRVRLRFLKAAMDRRILHVSAKEYGVSARRVSMSNDETTTTIDLGALAPEERVKVAFTLLYPEGQPPERWETVFQGAEPSRGKARKGDPGMTMVGRFWFNLFGRWLPF